MAERRMISNKIIDSAPFLRAPVSSQALYFHLIAKADDDGVVEAFKVIRMTNTSEDDLRVLVAKGFVKILNDDLVTFIMDWREHNSIRSDRKRDSIYQSLLLKVLPNIELQTPTERADRKKDDNGTSHGRSRDGLGEDSRGEDSRGEDSRGEDSRGEDMRETKKLSEQREELFVYALLKDQALQFEKFENYYLARNMELSNWPRAYDSWLAKAVEFEKDNWRERTPRLEKMKLRNTTTGEIEEQEVYYCRIAGYIVFPDGTYRKAQAKQQEAEQEQEPTYRRDVSKLLEGVRNASAY